MNRSTIDAQLAHVIALLEALVQEHDQPSQYDYPEVTPKQVLGAARVLQDMMNTKGEQ